MIDLQKIAYKAELIPSEDPIVVVFLHNSSVIVVWNVDKPSLYSYAVWAITLYTKFFFLNAKCCTTYQSREYKYMVRFTMSSKPFDPTLLKDVFIYYYRLHFPPPLAFLPLVAFLASSVAFLLGEGPLFGLGKTFNK